MKNPAEHLADELELRIEHDFCVLQRPGAGGSKRVLAAVYPRKKKIVLFEHNIADHCRHVGIEDINTMRTRLIRHEIGHYVSWLKKRKSWNPADPEEEAAASRFAADTF